ncbi:MAG TPA: DUF1579 family protein [Bacteroidota bacterium]
MKTYPILFMLVLAAFSLQPVRAQSEQEKKMEAFIKTLSPVEEHKILHRWVGNWDIAMQMGTALDKPPVGKGTIKGRMMFGGRFLFLETEGISMGRKVSALTIVGYDVHTKQYYAVATGENSTAMYTSRGTYDSTTSSIDLHGEMDDPFGKRPVRYVYILKEGSPPVFDAYDTQNGVEKLIVRMTCQPAQK